MFPCRSKTLIGDYLGERDDFNLRVMHCYVDALDFTEQDFDEAIRWGHGLESRAADSSVPGGVGRREEVQPAVDCCLMLARLVSPMRPAPPCLLTLCPLHPLPAVQAVPVGLPPAGRGAED